MVVETRPNIRTIGSQPVVRLGEMAQNTVLTPHFVRLVHDLGQHRGNRAAGFRRWPPSHITLSGHPVAADPSSAIPLSPLPPYQAGRRSTIQGRDDERR